MVSLGEMAAYLPHKKGFAGYTTRFWHPAYVIQFSRMLGLTTPCSMGFALGWNYLMKYLIVTPNNINAAGKVVVFCQLRPAVGKCLGTIRANMPRTGIVINYWTSAVPIGVWMAIFILLSEYSLFPILCFH